jgi:hypothetical protein
VPACTLFAFPRQLFPIRRVEPAPFHPCTSGLPSSAL